MRCYNSLQRTRSTGSMAQLDRFSGAYEVVGQGAEVMRAFIRAIPGFRPRLRQNNKEDACTLLNFLVMSDLLIDITKELYPYEEYEDLYIENTSTHYKGTSLHTAAATNSFITLEYIMRNVTSDTHLLFKSKTGNTPLMNAFIGNRKGEHTESIELLLSEMQKRKLDFSTESFYFSSMYDRNCQKTAFHVLKCNFWDNEYERKEKKDVYDLMTLMLNHIDTHMLRKIEKTASGPLILHKPYLQDRGMFKLILARMQELEYSANIEDIPRDVWPFPFSFVMGKKHKETFQDILRHFGKDAIYGLRSGDEGTTFVQTFMKLGNFNNIEILIRFFETIPQEYFSMASENGDTVMHQVSGVFWYLSNYTPLECARFVDYVCSRIEYDIWSVCNNKYRTCVHSVYLTKNTELIKTVYTRIDPDKITECDSNGDTPFHLFCGFNLSSDNIWCIYQEPHEPHEEYERRKEEEIEEILHCIKTVAELTPRKVFSMKNNAGKTPRDILLEDLHYVTDEMVDDILDGSTSSGPKSAFL